MSVSAVVVADTTPLNYLILIDESQILASLFREVLIPKAVQMELTHPKAPEPVRRWLNPPQPWLHVATVRDVDATVELGKGETEVISLAIERRISVVLMDARRGRAAAEARGLLPVGT